VTHLQGRPRTARRPVGLRVVAGCISFFGALSTFTGCDAEGPVPRAEVQAEVQLAVDSVAATQAPPPRPVPGSSPIALTRDGGLLGVVNPDSGSITLMTTDPAAVLVEIPVGRDPSSLAFTPDGRNALVTSARDGTLVKIDVVAQSVSGQLRVGLEPSGVLVGPEGRRAWVSNLASDSVTEVDLVSWRAVRHARVADEPVGLALTADAHTLLVTHLKGRLVSAVDTETLAVVPVPLREIPFDPNNTEVPAGRPNRMKTVAVHPFNGEAWLPAILSNSGNFVETTFNTTVFPAVIVVDTGSRSERPARRTTLYSGLSTVTASPEAVAFSPDGRLAYLVSAASNDLTAIDVRGRHERRTLRDVGDNPRGIAVHPDGRMAYLFNRLAPEVTLVDLEKLTVAGSVRSSHDTLEPSVARGRRLLFTSATPEVARDRFIACESCHFDGREDGETWFFDFGPRRTMTMEDTSLGKGLLHHSGDRENIQDFQDTFVDLQGGTGLSQEQLDDLAAFANSGLIRFWTNPHRTARNELTDEARRGQQIFQQRRCGSCHAGRSFTDASGHDDPSHPRLHDVGTFAEGRGARDEFDKTRDQVSVDSDPPRPAGWFEATSLLGLWSRPPYLHHGAAKRLDDLFGADPSIPPHGLDGRLDGRLDDDERTLLVAYLLQL